MYNNLITNILWIIVVVYINCGLCCKWSKWRGEQLEIDGV